MDQITLVVKLMFAHTQLDLKTCKMLSFANRECRKLCKLEMYMHKHNFLHTKLILHIKTITNGNMILLAGKTIDTSAALDIMIHNRIDKPMEVYFSVTLSYLLHCGDIHVKPWFLLNPDFYVKVFWCPSVSPRVEIV